VVLFAFSPVALQYHRMVFLDNLAIVWALAALVFAASPRRSLAAAVGCGITFGCAVLTKETVAILLPVVIWMLVQHTDKRTRRWNLSVAGCTMFGVGCFYPLYSVLKKEFLEGPGHVSLLASVVWQLADRPGSGSLLDRTSDTFALTQSWLELDPWLLLVGSALIPIAFCFRNLRPIALGLLLQIVVMFRGGYLPYPYVISLLPFAALIIGGVGNNLWSAWQAPSRGPGSTHKALRIGAGPVVLIGAALFALSAAPAWGSVVYQSTTIDLSTPPRQATEWIEDNIDKQAVIIVDDYVWPDLALRGYQNQIWSYKADLDPEVRARLLPNGWASADYVALDKHADHTLDELPTVVDAIANSEIVASFGEGEIVIRKVIKPTG
jgi:4-amino-4-deoxy-L-arabinose transferase-like glycosyltransferase